MMKLMLTFVEWKYSSYNTAFNRDLVRSIQFSKWKAESQWIFTQWINQTLWSGELGCGEVIMRKCQVPHLLAAFNRFRKFESDTCFFSSCEIDITYSAEHLSFPSLKPIPPQPPTFVSPRSPPPTPLAVSHIKSEAELQQHGSQDCIAALKLMILSRLKSLSATV